MGKVNQGDYRMPAEWEPQAATWLSWPCHPESWPNRAEQIECQFLALVQVISERQAVCLNAAAEEHERIFKGLKQAGACLERVQVHAHPNNDAWCRDHGPVFVQQCETGELAVVDWEFNGWGDKFGPYDLDNQIPLKVASTLGVPRIDGGMVLEGGSIDVNSHGQVLTTEAVLLNPNRNPSMDRERVVTQLQEKLGATEVFWLGQGVEGDDTDGHVDDVARFVADGTIVLAWETDEARSHNVSALHENRERLQDFRTPDGSRAEVIEIPLPRLAEVPGWRLPCLPASYVNFLVINGAVLVPTFGDREHDKEACGILGELFGDREIVPIPSLDFVHEGGAVHCLTQQQPAVRRR